MIRRPPRSTLFPTRRSSDLAAKTGRHPEGPAAGRPAMRPRVFQHPLPGALPDDQRRSEEHTSELQSHVNLVCRLLLEKKKKKKKKKQQSQNITNVHKTQDA